jgi:hypothetical protein
MIDGHAALRRLREGNERFASEAQTGEMFLKRMRSAKTDVAQEPIAIILGCSDARVPIEMVFDQELGACSSFASPAMSSRRRNGAAPNSRPRRSVRG